MTEKKNEGQKTEAVSENLLHHPTYLDCSYENIVTQKYMGFFFINQLFSNFYRI